jgi:hypothetical protein
MNVARELEAAAGERRERGRRRGKIEGGEGGGGEYVDDREERDAKDDVMMMVIACIMLIIIAWLSSTQSIQGEEARADVLLSSSMAMTMSQTLPRRTPEERDKL